MGVDGNRRLLRRGSRQLGERHVAAQIHRGPAQPRIEPAPEAQTRRIRRAAAQTPGHCYLLVAVAAAAHCELQLLVSLSHGIHLSHLPRHALRASGRNWLVSP